MTKVDLNCDMGESYGRYKLGDDAEILDYITSANIACGLHAGDPVVMDTTVALAGKKGVAIGAHPSFPDLQGFGRRPMVMSKDEIRAFLVYQIGALKMFTHLHGYPLQHVKLHGALYNLACCEQELAEVTAQTVAAMDQDLILVALYNSQLYQAGKKYGLRVAGEFFADRNYANDGSLLPRSHPEALISDEDQAAERCLQAVFEEKLAAADGTTITVKADTICLHGDSPQALSFSRKIKNSLQSAGVTISPLWNFL
ncbi:LamB/YcsF family protein [Dethiobacter alkaliphilus]|uniref:5-oxoprolinase subunit A n=1 Tax=Dethiobacter alkaliphilus AHT 1 TaxID=555088 RepID=C0GH20_DETAL|nr:5-oxoprolinase subunit PxpA [Dethiobacter alkaliphilus]EEG77322.1 LamB/YcsF family protein [Dethiobacter alkaliphilus AHT 1]